MAHYVPPFSSIMYVKIRDFRALFLLLATLSLTSMLFFAKIKQHYLSSRFANATERRNSTFYENGRHTTQTTIHRLHPCFTVGYGIPKTKNGLGNHLFYYAGAMYVAWLTGRKPLILTSPKRRTPKRRTKLDKAFNLNIARQGNQKPCSVKYLSHIYVYAYNPHVYELINVDANVSIRLTGGFCSWKYTQPIEDQLRRKLRFHDNFTKFANTFLSSSVPPSWNGLSFTHVGVHVRRGDFLSSWAVNRGFTVASVGYLNRAMAYFVERHPRVQFIVASNDINWCRRNIKPSWFNEKRVNITFSVAHSTEQDLALLASCDHTVMTTGTYSWWAAFLANGTTVYYKHFPRRGSRLWKRSRPAEFFYPNWIGMD